MSEEKLQLKAKVQVIYYSTPDESLGQIFATPPKPLNVKECEEILKSRNIAFTEVLKKRYQYIDLEMTPFEAEKFLVVY